jgi:hypothetical protein
MMYTAPAVDQRQLKLETSTSDLVIVGGGMAGTCCAVTAARLGLRVTLVQDRPILGGNASSEVRLWILGATAHMGNNNRWAREGGVIDEILVENTYRNPEGNPLIFDTILLEKVVEEPNIRLLLNTAVFEVGKQGSDRIESITAFCSQNSTRYVLHAPLFVDGSGDGIVGFLAGAAFRMGAEPESEFGEKMAPSREYGELLGHSLYFYSKDVGQPVKFTPPSFALQEMTRIPRFRSFNAQEHGCRLWWIEYGGRLDTVHETETIKWELWKVIYGVWNYIKNSGNFPEAETLTLEWVGHIPGKRESRRFEGDYMLTQRDLIEQRLHPDAVAHGGWALDLHPADGVFSEKPGCNQWHSRGVYQIPYRCLYSRNVGNLFLVGRIFSASHVAFGSTRVQATLAAAAQAVGVAAAQCRTRGLLPRDLTESERMGVLQVELQRLGQFIPDVTAKDAHDLVQAAHIRASSELQLKSLAPDGPKLPLNQAWAQLLPVQAGRMPRLTFPATVAAATTVRVELRTSDRPTNHTPDVLLAEADILLDAADKAEIVLDFGVEIDTQRYVFVCFRPNLDVQLWTSRQRVTGVLSAAQKWNRAVSNFGKQEVPEGADLGVENFEFWTPERRPGGFNLALACEPPLAGFAAANIANGVARPTKSPNAWVAAIGDAHPSITLSWDSPQAIRIVELSFDTDFDHPMESVLMTHPERAMPFCVKAFRVCIDGREAAVIEDNHQSRCRIVLDEPATARSVTLEVMESWSDAPAAVFEVRCYP